MRLSTTPLTFAAGLALALLASSQGQAEEAPDPLEIASEMDRLAERELWPGFDPRDVPAAIFDGERTVLLRHPAPPEGFLPLGGGPQEEWNIHVFDGRYPAVKSNTSIDLAGTVTATALLGDITNVTVAAGLLAHECFHVYQVQHHPDWETNEAELFTYPTADTELLTLRRLESAALMRAVESEAETSACWTRRVLELRQQRFEKLPEGARGYERAVERYEGLARFIQWQVASDTDIEALESFPATQIRQRGYETGLAFARLLDRFANGWRRQVEDGETRALDEILADALSPSSEGMVDKGMVDQGRCDFSAAERRAIAEAARVDVEAVRRERRESEHDYMAREGWRIIIETPGSPLFPSRFDPLNVELLEENKILHGRMVELSGPAGKVEILGHPSLTEPAGEHPLWNGVRRFTLAGLENEPQITATDEGRVGILAEGIRLDLQASVERRVDLKAWILKPGPSEKSDLDADTWTLVWADEFDGDQLDLENWTPEVVPDPHNRELQYYTDRMGEDPKANIRLEDGALVIEARREDHEHRHYTSGRLNSHKKREFTYGRFEARIRQPATVGMWPAFWLLGADIDRVGWPRCGEIDIMEGKGRLPSWTSGAIHRGPEPSGNRITWQPYALPEGNFHDDWHVFTVDWQPEHIRWYVDGVLFQAVVRPEDADPVYWPFDQGKPFFIILNLAVGGWFDEGHPPPEVMEPQQFFIDYVRVYKRSSD